jgi:hypothetical protein
MQQKYRTDRPSRCPVSKEETLSEVHREAKTLKQFNK